MAALSYMEAAGTPNIIPLTWLRGLRFWHLHCGHLHVDWWTL